MRIEQLQYLVKISDTKSFTIASEQLYITQPSISQSITALEKELNVSLLRRTRLGAEPTEIGAQIIREARILLEKVDSIVSLAEEENQKTSTSVTVAAAPLITTSILPQAIVEIGTHPQFRISQLSIVQNTTSAAEQMILKGEADLAVIPYVCLPESELLTFTPLFNVQIMALVRKNSPIANRATLSFEDIQQHPVALFGSEYISFEHILARISAYGKPNIALKTSSPEMTKHVSLNSDLIGLAYDLSVLHHPNTQSGSLIAIPICDPVVMTFGILVKKHRPLTALVKSMIQSLSNRSEQIAQELASLYPAQA